MNDLAAAAMNLAALLAQKSMMGILTEFEAQLYETTARYAATYLKLADVVAQSQVLTEERRLDELRNPDDGRSYRTSA